MVQGDFTHINHNVCCFFVSKKEQVITLLEGTQTLLIMILLLKWNSEPLWLVRCHDADMNIIEKSEVMMTKCLSCSN